MLPDGYQSLDAKGGRLWVRREWLDCLTAAGALANTPLHLVGDEVGLRGGGRRPLSCRKLHAAVDGTTVLAKRVVRGGLLGRWLGSIGGAHRGLREIQVTDRAASNGVRVAPIVAAATVRRSSGPGFETTLLIAEIRGARDFRTVLEDDDPESIHRAARAAGRAVRALHRSGIEHEDLNLNNLLLCPDDEVALVDFGQSSFGESKIAPGAATKNLARLYRSVVKAGLDARLGRRGLVEFLRAYAPDGWKTVLVEVRSYLRLSLPLHRLSWKLQGRGHGPVRS